VGRPGAEAPRRSALPDDPRSVAVDDHRGGVDGQSASAGGGTVRRDGIGASGGQIDSRAAAGVGLVDGGDETWTTSAWSRAGYVHRHRRVGDTGRENHDGGESTS